MTQRISQAAFDLIVRFETGGRKLYNEHPEWPGGSSGVTIGFGYDLGYEKAFVSDWGKFLSQSDISRLLRCLGKTRSTARQALSGVRDIVVSWESAEEVFNERTLPQEIRNTLKIYPSAADRLPADAFGALVSLVFNRGTDLGGERRAEMRTIQNILLDQSKSQSELCRAIAAQFRSMKRLWIDHPDSDGDLVDRREDEAKLIEESV